MEGETAAHVLAAARINGWNVSDDQRVRWHRSGLLPRPKLRHLGKAHGTESVYPAGTAAQLVALLEMLNGQRLTVEPAGWRLWWDGWRVEPALARRYLEHVAGGWQSAAEQCQERHGDSGLSEGAWKVIEGRTDTPTLRQALRKLRRESRVSLKRLLLTLAAGTFDGLLSDISETDSDKAAFEHSIGMSVDGLDGLLRSFHDVMAPARLLESLACDDATLDGARNECRELLERLDDLRIVGEHVSAGAFRLTLPRLCEMRPETSAMLFLAWLSMRRLPTVAAGLAQVQSLLRPFAAYRKALDRA